MIGSVEISSRALRHNAQTLRGLVTPAKTAFVVKSNAYGHGMIETARAIADLATYICTYSLDEALQLHAAGIAAPLFVLGPIPPAQLGDALRADINLALWDTGAYRRDLERAAQSLGVRAQVHVKVNTGVARLGLEAADAPAAIASYAQSPHLAVTGIFSHLASAEELDSPFTLLQLERLHTVLDTAAPHLETPPVRHIAASAAAMLWPQTRLDMVRIGIALYGLWPSAQTHAAMTPNGFSLEPALQYTSSLVTVREIDAGTPVGYGSTYHAPRHTRIGVVPLGYADGIPRVLSNRGAFLVDGVRCPIVGRVCMNMTMIDLAAAPAAKTGSRVILIGSDGTANVSADDWATWADTINYEIVTRIPSDVPRIFASD